jgi:hypothetical protein
MKYRIIPFLLFITFAKLSAQDLFDNELSVRQRSLAFVGPMCEVVIKEKDPQKWLPLQLDVLNRMTDDLWPPHRLVVMQLHKKFPDSTTTALEVMLNDQVVAWTYESCLHDSGLTFETFEERLKFSNLPPATRQTMIQEHRQNTCQAYVQCLAYGHVDSLNALFDSSQTVARNKLSLDTLSYLLSEQSFLMDVLPKAQDSSGSMIRYRFDLVYQGETVYQTWISFDKNDIYCAIKGVSVARVGKPLDPDFFKSPESTLELRYRMLNGISPTEDRFNANEQQPEDTLKVDPKINEATAPNQEAPKNESLPATDKQLRVEAEAPKQN